uniref:Valine--tRNA ligase n=1 Tax=candidate division WOR-3 bacterium TaxID=2052148 RepID=A0A7V3VU05_UNCW3
MEDFSTKYDPKGIEDRIYEFWLKENLFTPNLDSNKPSYTITIPPPNVTGRLTLGHILNNTIQDILIRYKKMSGYETLWVPGMDHAGIATQVKVEEERLLPRGIRKEDLGREKFLEEVWKWKEEYAEIIRTQLKKMGCALDWSRECFTLSEDYSKKVIKVFVDLYNKNLIYRGERIINWCPRCLTALSDEQVETENRSGKLYYINYPIKNSDNFITVATTRPETMLGDTAVCVNPDDPRYKNLTGKVAILPIMNREIPIIADPYVDPEFGTGALKVTPAHDPFDFELSKKHNLQIINIMNPDGTLNDNAGEYKGMERFEARKRIIEHLDRLKLLKKIENYTVPMAICERCETPIEPRLSKQWFVRMKPLAQPALEVVREGKIKIYPKRWINLYNHWLENVKDWCISRQLWWGHRIPIYYCKNCYEREGTEKKDAEVAKGIIVAEKKPEKCPYCGSTEIYQDEDVLDTWFSSWLWPFATLGWPEETRDYKRFYPTQTLATGWDIIYLWVARMIMAGLEFTKSIPFSNVVFHPMIRDEKGRKMSKSLGNSPEPMDLIDKYGADALRFGLLLITPREQDVLYSEKSIDVGRKFCNKLWNAGRLILTSFPDIPESISDDLTDIDRWILYQFNVLLKDAEYYFNNFELNALSKRLYDFFWHTFCDWYLEMIKVPPYNKKNIVKYLFKQLLKVLHPFIPFITEELYQRFNDKKKSILLDEFPQKISIPEPEPYILEMIKLIEEIRNIRGLFSIPSNEPLNIILSTDEARRLFIDRNSGIIQKLGGVNSVAFGNKPKASAATIVMPKIIGYVLLKGIDIEREKKRLEEEVTFLTKRIDELKNRLNNPKYLDKVKPEVRKKEEERLEESLNRIAYIKQAMENL